MRSRRVFLLAFAAFFLISAAWALALPANGTYDEKHHILRAYAVASGNWLPDGPASDSSHFGTEGFDVPAGLLPDNIYCTVGRQGRGPASCQVPVTGEHQVRPPTAAARYSPVYYLPIGLPLLVSPDQAGLVAARLVSGLISALLLAAAVATAVRLGSRMLVAAVALVCTPLAMNLNGSINPNGLEIAAGVLLFVALSALLSGVVSRRMLVLAGVAAAILLTVRQLGPVLFAVDVAACLLLAGRVRVAALWRARYARPILGGFVAGGIAVYIAWTGTSGGSDQPPLAERAVHGDVARQIVTERIPFFVEQIVGQFGYGETTLSPYAILLWYLLFLAVVIPALVWGGWRLRLVLGGLVGFCLALLVATELHYAPRSGWFAQGRYVMPTVLGVVLLAALAWPPGGWSGRRWGGVSGWRWLPLALVAGTVPVHLYALARVMTRFSGGLDAPLNPFAGPWHPAGGAAVPLNVAAAGSVALVLMILVTQSSVYASPGTVSGELDNGWVTPIGQGACTVAKASTTDAASH